MNSVITFFTRFLNSRWFWLLIFAIAVLGEASALYYQHVLGYGPCMVCIQIRIWLLGILIVSGLMLVLPLNKITTAIANLSAAGLALGMLERSWFILGTERGFSFGSCSFNLGLPEWFALDVWFPALFEVVELCGLTPVLVFNITMAEALVANSAGFILAFVAAFIAGFFNNKTA